MNDENINTLNTKQNIKINENRNKNEYEMNEY